MDPVQVIREYIHAKKGVWVDIAEPQTALQWVLFKKALAIAMQWKANS